MSKTGCLIIFSSKLLVRFLLTYRITSISSNESELAPLSESLTAIPINCCLEALDQHWCVFIKDSLILIENVAFYTLELLVWFLGGSQSSAELMANLSAVCEPPTKIPRLLESQSNTNTSPIAFDAPKRTRFTFRPEHLDVSSVWTLDSRLEIDTVILDPWKSFSW